ncbi:site-specific integrase [Antrihabitans stalactiti]|uniref:Site-specific integrase n=1 Tax=Antrihabitans stalactiti TaxID=2584121 RepID=A0A848K442_9NOCA|nr:site-specific integrase [Antrihabitans stalactiti]
MYSPIACLLHGKAGSVTRNRRTFGRLRQVKPSNRWQAAYVGPDGNVHKAPSTFGAKVDAEAWLTDRRREIDRELWSPSSGQEEAPSATFAVFAEAWLTQRTLKSRTRAHYRDILDDYLLPTFDDTDIRLITSPSVRKWYATAALGKPTTRAHAYGLLKSILTTAAGDGLIPSNPCTIVGAGTSKRVKKIKPATLPEIEALVTAMPDRYKVMTLLAAWCGLRFGELTELRRKDIDTKNGVVRIRRAVVRVSGGFEVTTPKSDAGTRDVAVPPHLMPAVERHLMVHTDSGRDALLFPAQHGGHLAPSALYRQFYKARDAAGRPDLRWHDLRHTGAVLAASTGATLAELMGRLGHSTPQAALRYQHTAAGRDHAIAQALSAMVRAE